MRNQIINIHSTKFLALFIDSSLSWNKHFAQLMATLSAACYANCSVEPFVNHETLSNI